MLDGEHGSVNSKQNTKLHSLRFAWNQTASRIARIKLVINCEFKGFTSGVCVCVVYCVCDLVALMSLSGVQLVGFPPHIPPANPHSARQDPRRGVEIWGGLWWLESISDEAFEVTDLKFAWKERVRPRPLKLKYLGLCEGEIWKYEERKTILSNSSLSSPVARLRFSSHTVWHTESPGWLCSYLSIKPSLTGWTLLKHTHACAEVQGAYGICHFSHIETSPLAPNNSLQNAKGWLHNVNPSASVQKNEGPLMTVNTSQKLSAS